VLVLGALAAVPTAVSAQEDQVTISATVVDQDGRSVGGGIDVTAEWDGGSVNGTTVSSGQVLLDVPRGANVSIQIDDDRYVRNTPYRVEDATAESVDVPVATSATADITVRNTDGQPVENARVLLYQYGSNQFVTDQQTGSDGTVTTPAVESRTYRLDVLKSGYYTNRTRVEVQGETNLSATIEQGEVLLTVSVVDDNVEPAEPLDAAVEIPSVATLQTGTDGESATRVPVNTRYDISVTKDGYDRNETRVRVAESSANATITLARTDRIDIDASDRAVVGGRIYFEATDEYGNPATNATVSLDGEVLGRTDDSGELRITPESAGVKNYTIDDGETQSTVTISVFAPGESQTGTPAAAAGEGSATATETTSGGSGPGFTPVTAAAAVALLSLVAYRRR